MTVEEKKKYQREYYLKYRVENREAISEQSRKYYLANREKITRKQKKYTQAHKEEISLYNKKYRVKNLAKIKARQKKWSEENREHRKVYEATYRKDNREKVSEKQNAWARKQMEESLEFRLTKNLRARLCRAINGRSKSASTKTLIGCTTDELREHLESQFRDGMTWENYGFYGWHIDHIKPCSAYNLLDPKEQKECFNYKNLQPLWAEENIKKGNKYKAEK